MCYSLWYNAPTMMSAAKLEAEEFTQFFCFQVIGLQNRGCIIPQAARSSAPEDGRNHHPKYVELTRIINKPLLLHVVGGLYHL